MRYRSFAVLAGAAVVALSACSGGSTPAPSELTSVGDGEGALSVLAWPGYVENGSTDPSVDWTTPFEDATGCQTDVQVFQTSDEAFTLFSTNPEKYDVISASGDASLRLVRAGYVQPVNTDLVPSYADIFDALKDQPYNTVDGVHYGIPHGRGSNLLMWRTDVVTSAPDSWSAMFDPASPYSGKVSVYDAPIYIADAAVLLMSTNPELGIQNPYALDDSQFTAAVNLLKQQKPTIGQYWTDYTKQMEAFTRSDAVIGTTWEVITNLLRAETPPVPVDIVKPKEGATGWSDTWMVNSKTKHINCAYKFLDYIVSPEVNAQIAEWFGEAPGNSKACEMTADPEHCANYHADDTAFWTDVWYWQTPETTCVDGRTDAQCKGFDDWVKAWTEIKG